MPGGQRPGPASDPGHFRSYVSWQMVDAYRMLVASLTAEIPQPPDLSKDRLGWMWYRYSPEVQTRLQTRFGLDNYGRPSRGRSQSRASVAEEVILLPPGEPPYEAVRTALQNAAGSEQGDISPAARILLRAWQNLKVPDGDSSADREPTDLLWLKLALRPGGVALLAARDRGVLALLASPTQPIVDGPAPPALRGRLEKALGENDANEIRRLLAIDYAASLLSWQERGDWLPVPGMLEALREGGDGAYAARRGLTGILRRVQDAGFGEAIARRLKDPAGSKAN
jgi:hypothetical protein